MKTGKEIVMDKKIIRLAAFAAVLAMAFSGCAKSAAESQQTPIVPQSEMSQEIPQKCSPATEKGFYRTEVIFPSSSNVLYVDFENQQELFLCPRPDCQHSDDSCTSYNAGRPIACIGDKLVLLGTAPTHKSNVPEEELPQAVYVCNLDGSERKRVYTAESGQRIHDTDIYQQGTHLFLIDERSDDKKEKMWQRLLDVDLSSGKETVLWEFEEGSWGNFIAGGCPGGLLLQEGQPGADGWTDELYRFDLKTRQKGEPIFTGSEKDRIFVEDNTLYRVQDESRITACNMLTGEEKSAEYAFLFADVPNVYASSIYPVFDDWMMVSITTEGTEETEEIEKNWLLNLSSGENMPFTLVDSFRGHALIPAAGPDDKLFVCVDYDEVDWQWDVDGEISRFTLYLPAYAMISKEDYLNSQPDYQFVQRMYETE